MKVKPWNLKKANATKKNNYFDPKHKVQIQFDILMKTKIMVHTVRHEGELFASADSNVCKT